MQNNLSTVDIIIEVVCVATLIILAAIVTIVIVLALKQKRNYNKAKELIKAKEKHLKKEHKISSYTCFFNGNKKIPVITKKHRMFVEVVRPDNPEKIIQLDEAKEILKKNKSSETLSQEELEKIEEKLQ